MPLSSDLSALRARIEIIERHAPEGDLRPSAHAQRRRASTSASWEKAFDFGLAPLDARFGPGGPGFGVHEIAGPAGEPASAFLFAALMLARRLRLDADAQALVVQEAGALSEGGVPYAPGLWALGLDPARLVYVVAREDGEALRITDEAVRSGAVAAVVTEAPRAARRLDLAATQRLNLYGRQTRTPAFLLVPDLASTSAAMTRWRVGPAPSRAPRAYLGAPVLELDLVRNRLGPTGRLTVEWSSDDAAFRLADSGVRASDHGAPLRPPVAAPAAYRAHPAGTAAFRAPGSDGHGEERAQAGGAR